ncbi:MAG: thiamine-phosphate kinase, partial [Veillonella sp.]|nr:thiamine-phosphate kinase [Veillonella sp.]
TAPKSLLSELEKLAGITLIGEVLSGPPRVQMVTLDKTIKTVEAKGYNHFHEG